MSKKHINGGLFSLLLISILFVSSCEYEFIEPEKVILPDVISFSEDIIPIFNNKCNTSGCHVAGFGVLDLSEENAYNDLFRKGLIDVDIPENSKIYMKLIASGGTHVGRSNATDQGLILEWISKGAQNN